MAEGNGTRYTRARVGALDLRHNVIKIWIDMEDNQAYNIMQDK